MTLHRSTDALQPPLCAIASLRRPHSLVEQQISALLPPTNQSCAPRLCFFRTDNDLIGWNRLHRLVVKVDPLLVILSRNSDGVVASACG
jgi:hypothetical protein